MVLTVTWHADGSCRFVCDGDAPNDGHIRPGPNELPHQFAARMGHVTEEMRKLFDVPPQITHRAE